MKNLKAFLYVAAFGAVLLFPSESDGQLFKRLKARRAKTVEAPVNNTTCTDKQCPIHGGGNATNEDAEMEAYLATLGYVQAAGIAEVAPDVPAPEAALVPAATEAQDVDAALAGVEQAESALALAEEVLERAVEAENQAAIARSRAAEKEIERLTAAHNAQIEALREQLVDLEPTPEE